MDPSS
jgi:hypothetical protein